MGLLNDLALSLDQWATRVRSASKDVCVPAQEYTLTEAYERLSAVLGPDEHIEINLSLSWFHGRQKTSWRIWDGAGFHEGATLAATVNTCLLAHTPQPESPVAEAQQLLNGAMPVTF